MNPDQTNSDDDKRRATAARNSKIVNRRAALGMAWRQAFSAYRDAKDKAVDAVAAAGDKLKNAHEKPKPEKPPAADQSSS